MNEKEKKRIRRWRRKHKGVVQSDEEILDLLSHSGRKSNSKSLISKDKIFVENEENKGYNVKIKFKSNPVCFVCNSTIDNFKEASWVVGSKGYGFYHRKKCGPGTQKWVKNHPTLISLLVFLQSKGMIGEGEGGDVFRDYKKWRRNLTNKKIVWSEGDVVMFLSYMKIREQSNQNKEDHIMSKKEKEVEKKKGGAGSGLVPKEPVQVPKELYKNKTIGKILETMRDTDDPEVKRACRKQLRDNGFKLSDESTWKPFLKGGKAVKDEDEEDEEEEAPKKSKKDKKAEKKVDKKAEKKGKKAKIEEDEEDEDEEDEEDDD